MFSNNFRFSMLNSFRNKRTFTVKKIKERHDILRKRRNEHWNFNLKKKGMTNKQNCVKFCEVDISSQSLTMKK